MLGIFTTAAQQAVLFVTGRGMTSVAVGAAAGAIFGFNRTSHYFPIIGLGLSIPLTAGFATVEHKQIEKRLIDRYRDEIGAALGIPPAQVELAHLRLAAKGDPGLGLPGNRTIDEALTRNDRHRMISILANVGSAVLTMAAVLSVPGLIAAGVIGEGVVSATAVWLGSTAVSFGLDVALKRFGNALFSYDGHPSLDQRIEAMARGRRHGHAVGIEQVMALVVDANPAIAAEIEQQYGVTYAALPALIRKDVIAHYEPAFELRNTVDAINLGRLPASELAFTVEGVRSGAFPAVAAIMSGYRQEVAMRPAPLPIHHIPGIAHARDFVNRVRPGRPAVAAASFADRVSNPAFADLSSKTIH